MDYQLNYSSISGIIPLPSQILNFLNECSSDYLKVLLFILGSHKKPTIDEISKSLVIDSNNVKDAIKYWSIKGILSIDADNKLKKSIPKPSSSDITSDELVLAKQNDKEASMLFEQAELLYNRPLKPSERRNLLFILETTNLSVDIILMAIDYSLRIDKPSSRYLLTICENWDDNDINSHSKAEEYIKFLIEKNQIERLICNCFGIHNRKLSSNECKSIDKWVNSYKFSIEMIEEAYNRCIDNTGKLSFPYIGKILSKWNKSGVDSIDKIEDYENSFKNKKENKKDVSRSYDIEALEKKGLFIKE